MEIVRLGPGRSRPDHPARGPDPPRDDGPGRREGAGRGRRSACDDLGTVECHDCFTISGLLSVEAIGLAEPGEGAGLRPGRGHGPDGARSPSTPAAASSAGAIRSGGTGVRQAVTLWQQLTGRAGAWQIDVPPARPYGLSVNMGGNDKTVIAIVYRRAG